MVENSSRSQFKLPVVNMGRLILIFGLLTAFGPFATDMYLSGFPDIARALGCSVEQVQLSLSTFMLGMALGQLFYGPLIDHFGRRLPLLTGLGVFTAASLAIIWSPDVATFTSLRFVQAVGGCAGMIISRAVIQDLLDPLEAAHALSAMMMVQGIGPIAAPVLGGYLLSVFHWGAVFVFLAVLGLFAFVMVATNVPETRRPVAGQTLALRTVFSNFGHLLALPEFMIPALSSSLGMACVFGFISGSPYVFMTMHGVDQQTYGWLFGFNALGMAIAGQINRILLRRFAPDAIYPAALLINVCAGALLVAVAGTSHLYFLMIPLFVCLATIPAIGANGIALAMAHSGAHAGSASSLIGAMQFVLASAVSALVSLLHNGTAYPMAGVILACGLLACLVVWGGSRIWK